MKKQKKVIILLIIGIIILLLITHSLTANTSTDETLITKKLYTNESVSNMSLAGTNRGNWHDRQNLGIYMKAGSGFQIRQKNLKLNQNLTLDCLNNDSATEKSFTIPKNGDWVTVTVDVDSVPFIRTLYGVDEKPEIEMRALEGTEELTYYYYGDNEKDFFDKWNSNNHEYAVIENERATFLVPIKDRENIVKENPTKFEFGTIDEMLEYYSDFCEQFDRFLGLSYNAENELDKNVKTKFFVKANKHGAGAAYYGGNHTAQNGDSISGYLSRNWLDLHEFGHGYEGSLANQDLSLVDVMNNILAHYYQRTFLDENEGGWLGLKTNIEENIKQARDNATTFNELSYQQKLYMFVDLLDKIGPEKSMGYVHSKYREYISQGIRYNASDMFSKSFSEVSNYNVIPYLNSFKITPSEDIQTEVYEKELPMIYYLKDLVKEDSKAEQIRKELGLDGKYALISNEDISKYNMKGSITLKINIDKLQEIKGQKIYIKDGTKVIKEIIVENEVIKITDLPVGIYTLQVPNPQTEPYKYDYEYIIVKENSNTEKNIEYTKINSSPLASDTQIKLLGLGDSEFAKITMDLENKNIRINSYNTSPHVYFNDEYAYIEIIDKDGKTIYEKSYIGNQASPSDDTLQIDIGYKIKLRHREATGRLVFQSEILSQKEEFGNTSQDDTIYVVTKYGLQKEEISDEEQYEIYKRKLDKYIEKTKNLISDDKQDNIYYYPIQKNKILAAILALNDTDKEKYINENYTLIYGAEPKIIKLNEYKMKDSYIFNIKNETTLKELKNNIETNGEIKVIKDDTELKDDEIVGTGMILKVIKNGAEIQYKLSILGDLTGDGKVTATDLSTINKQILKTISLEGEYKISADLDENDKITATDMSTINKIILKIL